MYCYTTSMETLLCRIENSTLNSCWRYDIKFSYLHISRMNHIYHIAIIHIVLIMHRNINLFPFQPAERPYKRTFLIDPLGLVLRSANSMLTTIALKPFLTSVIKGLAWLLATTTKICTNAWSKQDHSLYSSYHYIYNASHQLTSSPITIRGTAVYMFVHFQRH